MRFSFTDLSWQPPLSSRPRTPLEHVPLSPGRHCAPHPSVTLSAIGSSSTRMQRTMNSRPTKFMTGSSEQNSTPHLEERRGLIRPRAESTTSSFNVTDMFESISMTEDGTLEFPSIQWEHREEQPAGLEHLRHKRRRSEGRGGLVRSKGFDSLHSLASPSGPQRDDLFMLPCPSRHTRVVSGSGDDKQATSESHCLLGCKCTACVLRQIDPTFYEKLP